MNIYSPQTQCCFVALLIALTLSGCDRESKSSVQTMQNAFAIETLTNLQNRQNWITFLSSDECEVASNGRIILGKYSEKDGQMRIVLDDKGSKEVVYFRRDGAEQGRLVAVKDGATYLNKTLLAAHDESEHLRQLEVAKHAALRQRALQEAEQERINQIVKNAPKIIVGKWRLQRSGLDYWEIFPDGSWEGGRGQTYFKGTWSIDRTELKIQGRSVISYVDVDYIIQRITPATCELFDKKDRSEGPLCDKLPKFEEDKATKLLVGNWASGREGFETYLTYRQDGSFTYIFPGGREAKGTWKVKGDQIVEAVSHRNGQAVTEEPWIVRIWSLTETELRHVTVGEKPEITVAHRVVKRAGE